MYRYNSYIARHLVHSTLLITFSLTSIVWLTQALRFIDFIVNQGVSIMMFLTLTVLLIPSLLFMILPPALFSAVLFTYNKLRADSELVVMQAAGLSNWRLARPALQVALVVTLITYGIAFYLQPVTYKQFKDMQAFLRNTYASILLQDGVFSTPVDGLMVFIREKDKDNTLHGILVHDNRVPDAPVTMMADEGSMEDTPQGPRFLLKHGNRQEMRQGRLSLLNFEDYTLNIDLYGQGGGARVTDPQELFLSQLFEYDDNLSPAENQRRFAEGHQRILWPFFAMCLTLVALAVLFTGEFNRRGQWQRLTMAGALATAILFGSVALRSAMAIQPHMIPIAYLNALIPCVISLWMLAERIGFLAPRIPKREVKA